MTDLLLHDGVMYYVTLVSCNGAQMCSSATSSGILVDSTPPSRGVYRYQVFILMNNICIFNMLWYNEFGQINPVTMHILFGLLCFYWHEIKYSIFVTVSNQLMSTILWWLGLHLHNLWWLSFVPRDLKSCTVKNHRQYIVSVFYIF